MSCKSILLFCGCIKPIPRRDARKEYERAMKKRNVQGEKHMYAHTRAVGGGGHVIGDQGVGRGGNSYCGGADGSGMAFVAVMTAMDGGAFGYTYGGGDGGCGGASSSG